MGQGGTERDGMRRGGTERNWAERGGMGRDGTGRRGCRVEQDRMGRGLCQLVSWYVRDGSSPQSIQVAKRDATRDRYDILWDRVIGYGMAIAAVVIAMDTCTAAVVRTALYLY